MERLMGTFSGAARRLSDGEALPDTYEVHDASPLFRRIEDAEVAQAERRLLEGSGEE
jgi:hypothetical protein